MFDLATGENLGQRRPYGGVRPFVSVNNGVLFFFVKIDGEVRKEQ